MMNQVFYELKFSGKLPSPAGVGMQILRLTQKEDCRLDEITRVVRSDPSLTGRILKVANAVAGKSASTATPLEEAVLRLGFTSLRDLVLGFSLISSHTQSACPGFDYGAFWHGSLGRAVASQHLTELSGDGSGSESYVCGLLCDIGRMGLAAAHPVRYGEVLKGARGWLPRALMARETEVFGIHHGELTEAMLCDWGFPEKVARAAATFRCDEGTADVRRRSEPLARLQRVLRAADGLVGAMLGEGLEGMAMTPELEGTLSEAGLAGDDVGPAVEAIRKAWAEWGALFHVSTSGAGHSEAPVEGISRKGVQTGADATASAKAVRGERVKGVLLLEPDDRSARLFESWLGPSGYQMWRARVAREALELVVAKGPGVVIAHGRSESESLALCRALRRFEAGRRIYFILAIAARDGVRLQAAFNEGVDDYLVMSEASVDGVLRLLAAERSLELRRRVADQEKSLEQNVAELSVANRKLHLAAMTDELTQLPNRRYAEEMLREHWDEVCRTHGDLSVIIGDIDHFKTVNDRHGHAVGDLMLTAVARVLRREIRSGDVACRMGGEEFMVICPGTDQAGAVCYAERLRKEVEATVVDVSGQQHRVTMSLGVASRCSGPRPVVQLENVLQAADDAMYSSKAGGRNCVSIGCPL